MTRLLLWLGRGLKNLLLRNFWLKFVSLLFAVSFYAFIHSAENVQRTVQVDLTQFLPPKSANRQLMTQIPDRISVTIAGPSSQLQNLRAEQLGPIAMDLTDGVQRQFIFDASMLNLPLRVTVQRIVPALLDLEWEDVVSRRVPVQVVQTGKPADGFEVVGDPKIEPAEVEVRGPESLVAVMQYVRSADFDVSELKSEGDFARQLGLERPAELAAHDGTYDVNSVLVTIRIARTLETQDFPNIPVLVPGLPRAVTVPPKVTVIVSGPPQQVARITDKMLAPRVEIDVSPDDPRAGSRMVKVQMSPLNVPNIDVEFAPPEVMVKW